MGYFLLGKIVATITILFIVWFVTYIFKKKKLPFGWAEGEELDLTKEAIDNSSSNGEIIGTVLVLLGIVCIGIPILWGITILVWPVIPLLVFGIYLSAKIIKRKNK